MTECSRRRSARLYRLSILAIAFIALIPPVLELCLNYPYYNYCDEVHLLSWRNAIFGGEAPDNIFYGPLLYYLYLPAYAVGDAIVWLTGTGEHALTAEFIMGGSPPGYRGEVHPAWMLPVARGFSMAFFVLAIFSVASALRRIAGQVPAIIGALLVASTPFSQEFAAYAQPEMAILGIGCLAFRYALRHGDRGFDARSTVILGLLFACLGALKIYALLYAGLGWIVILRSAAGERRRNALLFGATVLGASLLLYLPYRTPRELVRVMTWAAQYYHGKTPGSLIVVLLAGGLYTTAHLSLETGIHGATLPEGRTRRFSEGDPDRASLASFSPGDLLVLRSAAGSRAPEIEALISQARRIWACDVGGNLAIYRLK